MPNKGSLKVFKNPGEIICAILPVVTPNTKIPP